MGCVGVTAKWSKTSLKENNIVLVELFKTSFQCHGSDTFSFSWNLHSR